MTKQRFVSVFDRVPLVPVAHFEKMTVPMSDAWYLVGPTIHQNMRRSSPQQLYCIAFIEGIRVGMRARAALTETQGGTSS